jgi:hypothetical protein
MANRRAPSKIYPKVSTLPRQRTEAAHYLDLYKLTVEKKRIQRELESLNQRRQQLCDRLAEIEQQTTHLDQQAQHLRQAKPGSPAPRTTPRNSHYAPTSAVYLPDRSPNTTPDDYSTVVLDY